ncbi:hypothetical protein TBLA_0G00710 [Henningerozyma blattae CBS 6284]|uniref:ATP-dependent bile acid permease n=1 Tax=Henningerozyma blattae (strain ATCC 34711 / CBS 6284 / DSM 70876 / NBRC 10599 / NRRL Y-10934 / UCD 77-7) TaxID=1071380 RepID=I2H6L6_HENB6|nr:hypothetical protein TBLA_0G00710 [Tetrapisispora blattae CBS 6284]CCH62018.1 hypothetical protein TBLA_0G00710 [Tetrapisispora blattae CBS 6284]
MSNLQSPYKQFQSSKNPSNFDLAASDSNSNLHKDTGMTSGKNTIWYYDDFTTYGRSSLLLFKVPLALIIVNSLLVLFNLSSNYYKYNVLHFKEKNILEDLMSTDNSEEEEEATESNALLNNNATTNHASIEQDQRKSNTSLADKHFSIEQLKFIKMDGSPHGKPVILRKNLLENLNNLCELLLVILQFFIHCYVLKNLPYFRDDFNYKNGLINLFQWTFILLIVIIRNLINLNSKFNFNFNKYIGNSFWKISFLSYMILMPQFLIIFRSLSLNHIGSTISIEFLKSNAYLRNYYMLQVIINSILFCLLFFTNFQSKDKNILYKTDDWIIPSPESNSSVASFISWSWFSPFVWSSYYNSKVEKKDIWGLNINDYSLLVMKKFRNFSANFDKSQASPGTDNNNKSRFSIKLILFFSDLLLLQTFWAFIDSLIAFFPTILLKKILQYISDPTVTTKNVACCYIILMFISKCIVAVCEGQALFIGRRICIRMRSIIISEIYIKALRRQIITKTKKSTDEVDPEQLNEDSKIDGDEESTASANVGAIINLIAVDAFKVAEIGAYLHTFIGTIIMTFVSIYLLFNLLGSAAFIGALTIIVLIPVNYKIANWLGNLQQKNLKTTDKRIQKLNETFQAIRIIKFFSWEKNFENDIHKIREEELYILLLRCLVWSFSTFIFFISPTIVTSLSFAYYIFIQKQELTSPVAFTALSLFALLKIPLDQMANMLSYVVQSKVSLDRVQTFLDEPDTKKYEQLTVPVEKNKLSFKNATMSWGNDNDSFKLRNLDIDFKIGQLNVVIGPTGSGKTSLLMALLGEMTLTEGQINIPSLDPRHDLIIESDGHTNSIAYCSQAAWLLNDTVRNNILFNSPYNKDRYDAAIVAAGLKRDFEILAAGDLTEIGERGITLSGGQKQRISLARALYSNARHVLLDDCLSAVDAHTAAWIYDNCISGPLMEGRTCVLVSHNIALTLKNASLVVMLKNGRVADQGDPVTLLNKGALGEDELVKSSILSRNVSFASVQNLANKSKPVDAKKKTDEELSKAGKLVEEETKAEGYVSPKVYKWYFDNFGGLKAVSFLVAIFFVAQGMYIVQTWWVRDWVVQDVKAKFNELANTVSGLTKNFMSINSIVISSSYSKTSSHSTAYYLSIYFGIGVLHSSIFAIKDILCTYAGLAASRKMFNSLLKNSLHAKLRFFDSTPLGRIMNRFSKDIEAVDQEVPMYLGGTFACLVECFSIIVLITLITPQFLGVAIFIAVFYWFVGAVYISGSRELKRFDSITKSPIYQHFSETLAGITTVRAYGDESRFMRENLEKIDENNKPFFYMWVSNRWLSFRTQIIGAFVILGAGGFSIWNINKIDSGLAGISLTYALTFSDAALWLVRFYGDTEMNMNSTERIQEYMNIDQEPYNEGTVEPPADWPENGKIEINDVSLRYAPNLPRVIKNVSFTVDSKSKVGIVGRTGAGKSTIITALFRFLEPETGNIKIDNIDIVSIDLQKLRRSISIIPQDPTLFTGTIRSNLDPYTQYSDKEIFDSLICVNLVSREELAQVQSPSSNDTSSIVSENFNHFLDLEYNVSEGGSNISQGQRQLLCLARSLLGKPKIILLDEATASIDYESDKKIQETIRNEFGNSTILTIAHRLRSVIDYDKILVMDAGEVEEYDHPYSLLLNKNSIFYSMCEQSGEIDILIEQAKKAFVDKLSSK